ncbi:MAG TPA: DUF4160 domain-containing protein [Longimicrobiaceae bacterium]|nr:DUF4160 domain-containing protein [Longimicrobiaceae bacterium]
MPTIYRESGFAFRIYTDDHDPPHVHVRYAGERAKVRIGDEETPASVEDAGIMRVPNLVRAVRIVDANWRLFLERWEEIHG